MPTLEENVNRVKAAKTAIGNAITAKGGTVGANDGLEDFASDIATIPSGGGNYNGEFQNTPTTFSPYTNLRKVDVPYGITNIISTSFNACSNLISLTIPKSVNYIHSQSFSNLSNLNTINIYNTIDSIEGSPWGAPNAQINWLEKHHFTSAINEVSSGTTLTTSVSCTVGDLIVATFENLGGEYTLPSGWTLLGDSGAVTTAGYTQRTGMAYKIAEATTENFILTQASSGRMFTNLIAITGASIGTFSGFTKNETNNTIIATKPQGLTIWAVSTMWWGGKWDVSPTDNKMKISNNRCENVLDQSDDTTVTFTTDTPQTAGGLACASLTITGIDNFWYYDEPQT